MQSNRNRALGTAAFSFAVGPMAAITISVEDKKLFSIVYLQKLRKEKRKKKEKALDSFIIKEVLYSGFLI